MRASATYNPFRSHLDNYNWWRNKKTGERFYTSLTVNTKKGMMRDMKRYNAMFHVKAVENPADWYLIPKREQNIVSSRRICGNLN